MIAVALPVRFDGDLCFLEGALEALCLSAGVGIAGKVQNQEWWDAFASSDVRNGRKVDMFLRIIPKLLAVTKIKHLAAVKSLSELGCHNDLGNVVRISVHRNAAF